ncbi:MAG: hypothetical protein HYZ00_01270 [Candidatus Hydrogenedentes bacterium]|nr:hypothetical protein [Candidatus Hydrogenedentota bacterium]
MAKKSDFKMKIRDEALRKVKGPAGGVTGSREYRDRVEKMRSQMLQKAAEGGDSKASRIKSELNYLLNNYLPKYDGRIEGLIDEWRRTGDPSYDPGIRLKLRRARQDHDKNATPI